MMNNVDYINDLLKPYGPGVPLDRLIEEVNRLYHSFEAPLYDRSHPEIKRQLPAIWASMISAVETACPEMEWDVLDFGCGTGFATEQVLSQVPTSRLRGVTCYDPSPEMISQCQKRLCGRFPQLRTTSRLEDLAKLPRRFTVLITNSVLHHLPSPAGTLDGISASLRDDAVWLCGHEPSRRYYQNAVCVDLLRTYKQTLRWRRILNPKSYFRRIARICGLQPDPARQAAAEAHRRGLFQRRPSRDAVSLLVDFHVAHSTQEAQCGRGFDVRELQQALRQGWSLEWHRSYSFLGPYWQGTATTDWQVRCEELERRFPDDGANFCSVWRRTANSAAAAA